MDQRFRLDNVWRAVLCDLGVPARTVLKRAGLPLDLLKRPDPMVDVDDYFRLVEAFEIEADRPNLGLHIADTITVDVFDPTLFAASCSPNLEVALKRVSTYKRLMGPFRLDVNSVPEGLCIVFRCLQRALPPLLGMVDLAFTINWIRNATRVPIVPMRVGMPALPSDRSVHAAYFGVPPRKDVDYTLVFSELDAARPFVTENPGLWKAFEPELRRRLVELESNAPVAERVGAALLELLPSGRSQKQDVARALGVGERTLQRRLRSEGTSFQQVLASTREALTRHYLMHTELAPVEIAYLVGFEDPNSLYRAFHQWTGTTPEAVRRSAHA